MAHNHPGESAYSREQWQAIHPMFRYIYIDRGYSLKMALKVLELINNFKATVARGNRTRAKSIAGTFPHLPDYIAGLAVGVIPRSLSFKRFQDHFELLLSLDKYIIGFFDSRTLRLAQQNNGTVQDANDTQLKEAEQKLAIDGRWCRALSLCQEISIIPQKKKDIIDFDSFPDEINTNKAMKQEGIKKMKEITTGILKTTLFTKLEAYEKQSTPNDLPALWSICRVLGGLSFQLGYSKDSENELMRLFLEALRESFAQITKGPNTEMSRVLERLRNIPSKDLKDAARIGCLCSARALTSMLKPHDPVVLEAWTDYYQHYDKSTLRKDVFLNHYGRAYEEAKAKHQNTKRKADAERALPVLINYCYVAHYICHDRALAYRLSSEPWDLTSAALSGEKPPKAWSIEVQGMTEAAKIQALVCYIKHEDKLKTREELKVDKIHKYNLASRQSRRRYRRAVLQDRQMNQVPGYLPPYDPETQAQIGLQELVDKLILSPNLDFQLLATQLQDLLATLLDNKTQTMDNLRVAVWQLHSSNDADCQLLAAGLYDQLASITSACSQDVNSVLQSVKSLFKKANDSPLNEIELSNLETFLEKETKTRQSQGEDFRDSAKDLRRLVVVFDACVDLDQFISY
ncbi:subunit P of phosphatidylinositol n-acetylglucosaminyltransferase [Fusarium phyllophilum]|uniref:Subunit P of phosphatidylinositol n-acetylglucosaminyltransferase n=1 Tax=Fusarium phyllophilum TaxID=47803 RepID=A0A8H5JRX5_9HYPO|nr:subunit P of phosphatidylinositol n-acetylglucosaminyltransferase [Fusarium phyllophilum]